MINKTSISESDITNDVFGTDTTIRDSDVQESEMSPDDMGFCKRENVKPQKQEAFNSHTSLANPYLGMKDEKKRPFLVSLGHLT